MPGKSINIYTSANDSSTNDVIDWVYFLSPQQKITRLNDYYIPDQLTIHISKEQTKSMKSWYRRGAIFKPYFESECDTQELELIRKSYETENKFIYQAFIDEIFDQSTTINAAKDNNTNKIINLRKALDAELEVPETLVSNEPARIDSFLKENQQYIIKDVALDPINIEWENFRFLIGLVPQKLTGQEIKERLQDNRTTYGFLFIQKYIEKRVELRVFFIKGKLYTMAIFSQNNTKTQVDYRNYDQERPNRCIPFKLPGDTEIKLQSFMNNIGINCGSIDMIYTPDGRFVFLEVNPIGQFEWLARNCNYDIEREIAKFLLS